MSIYITDVFWRELLVMVPAKSTVVKQRNEDSALIRNGPVTCLDQWAIRARTVETGFGCLLVLLMG